MEAIYFRGNEVCSKGQVREEISCLFSLLTSDIVGVNRTFRFSGKHLNINQSVAEHAYWVAIIAGFIGRLENRLIEKRNILLTLIELNRPEPKPLLDLIKIYERSLWHDNDEVWTGDLNHKFKHYKGEKGENFRRELEELIKVVVEERLEENNLLIPEILNVTTQFNDCIEGDIVKIADWLQLGQYLLSEFKLGNKHLIDTRKELITKLDNKIGNSDLICRNILFSLLKKLDDEMVNNIR